MERAYRLAMTGDSAAAARLIEKARRRSDVGCVLRVLEEISHYDGLDGWHYRFTNDPLEKTDHIFDEEGCTCTGPALPIDMIRSALLWSLRVSSGCSKGVTRDKDTDPFFCAGCGWKYLRSGAWAPPWIKWLSGAQREHDKDMAPDISALRRVVKLVRQLPDPQPIITETYECRCCSALRRSPRLRRFDRKCLTCLDDGTLQRTYPPPDHALCLYVEAIRQIKGPRWFGWLKRTPLNAWGTSANMIISGGIWSGDWGKIRIDEDGSVHTGRSCPPLPEVEESDTVSGGSNG